MQSQYFELEPVLEAQIKTITAIEDVFTPFSVDDLFDLPVNDNGVGIIYVGDRVGETGSSGKITEIFQQWRVVLVVSDASAQFEGTMSIRQKADPLICALLSALQGFNPNLKHYRPLKRVEAGVKVGSLSGSAYFPFLFESQVMRAY